VLLGNNRGLRSVVCIQSFWALKFLHWWCVLALGAPLHFDVLNWFCTIFFFFSGMQLSSVLLRISLVNYNLIYQSVCWIFTMTASHSHFSKHAFQHSTTIRIWLGHLQQLCNWTMHSRNLPKTLKIALQQLCIWLMYFGKLGIWWTKLGIFA